MTVSQSDCRVAAPWHHLMVVGDMQRADTGELVTTLRRKYQFINKYTFQHGTRLYS